MPEQLTPEKALDLLDRVGQSFQGGRQDHINIQAAVNELRSFIALHTGVVGESPDDLPAESEE